MEQARLLEAEYRLTHRHGDGSWGEMAEVPRHHDPAAHDPERRWSLGRLFRCTECQDGVVVVPVDDGGVPLDEA